MNKTTAITIVQEYLSKKEFSWEAIYHVDEQPIEADDCWVFKNLWEPREYKHGNDRIVDDIFPGIIVYKASAIVALLSVSNRKLFDYFFDHGDGGESKALLIVDDGKSICLVFGNWIH